MSFLAILIASLLGSPHCVGMCGGFVSLCSDPNSKSLLPHIAYNFGRFLTYTLLGLGAGYFGSQVDRTGNLFGLEKAAAICIGLLMMLWGLLSLMPKSQILNTPTNFIRRLLHIFGAPVHYILSKRSKLTPSFFGFLIGFISTFLPCGWLYTFVAYAATTGSPLYGALVMMSFWVGTVPLLLGVGTFAARVTNKLSRYIPTATAILLVLGGFFSMFSHLDIIPLPFHEHHHPQHSHIH